MNRTATLFLLIALMGVLVAACSKDDEPRSRAFRMGFATLPYGSSEGLEYVYEKLSVESDIVNHHFESGVPWLEALAGEEFPEHILQDWKFRKEKITTPHKTFVSVTPLNHSHDGLAPYRGTSDNLALPSPWNQYAFDDDEVKVAYVNYCKRVIDFFQPDYFAMSIEANLLYQQRPDVWPRYLEFHAYVYGQLKAAYPGLPVFATIAGVPLLKGFLPDNDHVMQRLAAVQLLEMSDYYAISFYPPSSVFQSGVWSENTFQELFAISAKPVIVAETACTAEGSTITTDEGSFMFAADPVKQKLFVDALLAASDRWKVEFVIWFTLRDHDISSEALRQSIGKYGWSNAGLYDEYGNPRPALNSWRQWFRKAVEE